MVLLRCTSFLYLIKDTASVKGHAGQIFKVKTLLKCHFVDNDHNDQSYVFRIAVVSFYFIQVSLCGVCKQPISVCI